MRIARRKALTLVRALFAALSTLALLSAAIPFTVLSAAHSCQMPCCAGKDGSCATGACKSALFQAKPKTEEEKLCGAGEMSAEHGDGVKDSRSTSTAEASTNTDHCDADKKESAANKPRDASSETGSSVTVRTASARVLTAPCSKDCCAGASNATQSRRSRDAALLSALNGTQPPAFALLSLYSQNRSRVSSAHLKRLRARAPPFLSTLNLS